MLHDAKPVPMSPSKGKAKEKQRWQSDWWDFQTLSEPIKRPLEWSRSSTIFTAHPTQPLVSAHHFLSSKQFVLPSPAPVLTSSFDPPTVISVDPKDDWLFAYFPGQDGDGAACMWKRGTRVDDWNVKEWWPVLRGAGVVAATWLGSSREWVTDASSGLSVCLPPRGPPTPVSSPTLLLVSQDHTMSLYYYRQYMPTINVLRLPIDKPGFTVENRPNQNDSTDSTRQCFQAAIGLNYNDLSILIATRSYTGSLPFHNDSHLDDLDSISDEPAHANVDLSSLDGGPRREESVINLTEVQLRFNATYIGVMAEPMPPIVDITSSLVRLEFISVPPPSLVGQDSTKLSSPSRRENERTLFYLASTFLEFEDYSSIPKSELSIHAIARHFSPAAHLGKTNWMYRQLAKRLFRPQVLTFIAPCPPLSAPASPSLYVGVVDVTGALPMPSSSKKQVRTGEIRILRLTDLLEDEEREAAPILSPVDGIGRNVPCQAATSPNGILMSTLSSCIWPTRTSIHQLPRLDKNFSSLAACLSSAILSRRSAADITHILSLPATPLSEVFDTLYQATEALNKHQPGLSHHLMLSIVGEVMAVYRKRSLNMPKNTAEKEDLEGRWQTAHDLCSVIACNQAFEDSKEDEAYDLDAVWQLIALSTWVVAFTERLMKECVLFSLCIKQEVDDGTAILIRPLDSALLLHLTHPVALQKVISVMTHVKRYRAHLGALSAKVPNSRIAREALIDLVDNSGIDFGGLENILSMAFLEAKAFDKDDCLRALATCQPIPSMYQYLAKLIKNITQSSILHKPTLFIKPGDLVDDIGGLSLGSKKPKESDVILKRILVDGQVNLACQRCGGRSEIGGEFIEEFVSQKWRAWEKKWKMRCICGGSWMKDNAT